MVAAAARSAAVRTFFERITKDIEIVRVALLLTGCIQVGSRVAWKKGRYRTQNEIVCQGFLPAP